MLKKQLCKLLLLCFICSLLAGCAEKSEPEGTPAPTPAETAVDVDLTALSSTVVYAEVYNIMTQPAGYVGKTIKGIGVYNSFYYEEMDRTFHYFVISDATGCCPQGLDFVWKGAHSYPEDYPEIGQNVEVSGVFVKGEIQGQDYYHLEVDCLTVLHNTNPG